jgi:1-deoxy-D-xylulose-5-phosphate synthase
VLCKLASQNEDIVAITAAMKEGTGLNRFALDFPARFFDVGIAEQHAITMAAGMARGGLRPFVAIYSSFMQRAYDQVIHDVSLMQLPVVMCLDRAGLVGEDGPTHHGVFDVSFLRCIPDIQVMAPRDEIELEQMLAFASVQNGPVALRYPRGAGAGCEDSVADRRIPMITIEENALPGGFGSLVAEHAIEMGHSAGMLRIGIPDSFIQHGSQSELRRLLKIDVDGIKERIAEWLQPSVIKKVAC